jgi:hypothetical protein
MAAAPAARSRAHSARNSGRPTVLHQMPLGGTPPSLIHVAHYHPATQLVVLVNMRTGVTTPLMRDPLAGGCVPGREPLLHMQPGGRVTLVWHHEIWTLEFLDDVASAPRRVVALPGSPDTLAVDPRGVYAAVSYGGRVASLVDLQAGRHARHALAAPDAACAAWLQVLAVRGPRTNQTQALLAWSAGLDHVGCLLAPTPGESGAVTRALYPVPSAEAKTRGPAKFDACDMVRCYVISLPELHRARLCIQRPWSVVSIDVPLQHSGGLLALGPPSAAAMVEAPVPNLGAVTPPIRILAIAPYGHSLVLVLTSNYLVFRLRFPPSGVVVAPWAMQWPPRVPDLKALRLQTTNRTQHTGVAFSARITCPPSPMESARASRAQLDLHIEPRLDAQSQTFVGFLLAHATSSRFAVHTVDLRQRGPPAGPDASLVGGASTPGASGPAGRRA